MPEKGVGKGGLGARKKRSKLPDKVLYTGHKRCTLGWKLGVRTPLADGALTQGVPGVRAFAHGEEDHWLE